MRIKIMVASDYILLRQGLIGLLEAMKDFVIIGEAEDGNNTIEKVSAIKPDVLLLDVDLPKRDVLDTWINKHVNDLRLKIILLSSGKNDFDIRNLCFAANGYLHRNAGLVDLKEAIFSVAEGNGRAQNLVDGVASAHATKDFDREKIDALTRREMEVLRLLAIGMYNKEIAQNLDISERTVKNHVSNIFKKIIVNDRTQAAVFAIRNNLINI